MQINLFDKEGSISTSPVYIAYTILRVFSSRRTKILSIFKLSKYVKDVNVVSDQNQISYALMFLYMLGIIVINETDVILVEAQNA